MKDPETNHWTLDQDLVERYVLSRLSEEERQTCEAHLRSCPQCSLVVRREQEIAAGIKRAGRELLKLRLKDRMEGTAVRGVPWPHILSAAAVVVIVVGLGIYNRWFVGSETLQTERTEESRNDLAASLAETDTVRGQPERRLIVGPSARSMPQKNKIDSSTPLPSDGSRDKAGIPSKSSDLPVADKKESFPSGGQLKEDGIWVEGVVTEQPGERELAALQDERKAKQFQSSRKRQSRSIEIKRGSVSQDVYLEQKPAEALPPSQKGGTRSLNAVQTYVEKTDQGLRMTIYSDELGRINNDEAVVEPVTQDSLVVRIDSKRIGYKIPGGWGGNAKGQMLEKKKE